jgi:hypothetical protein
MDFIRGLATAPNSRGDFTERDASGRELDVKIVGRYAVTYWTDHAVKEIKVVDVRPADK